MKNLTDQNYKKIIARRDPRYDGRFYFGVKTTRIYCRPVCSARPKPENILIFRSPSEAEKSGFRPCLKCRPDLAPGSQRLDGTAVSVGRALRLIEESGEEEWDVASLALTLGMTDRHLRRLFDEHLGASPIEIIITRRLHLARQLISQTTQPLTEIAFASGFQSIRRFNEAFKNLYQRSPSAFRKNSGEAELSDVVNIVLPVRAPFDWPSLLAFFMRHESYGLERVEASTYTRFVASEAGHGTLRVNYDVKAQALRLELHGIKLTEIRSLIGRVKHLFDVDHNPSDLPPSSALPGKGIRIPGSFDGWETAVSIILGQLVSTLQAKAKMKTLIQRYGHRLADDEIFLFPKPDVLMVAALEEIGMTKTKAQAIRDLARGVHEGEINLSRTANLVRVREQLLQIKGIGPWTVEMIAMRCLGDADAFPARDLIIQRALESKLCDAQEWLSLRSYLTQIIWRDLASSLSKTKMKGSKEMNL